MTNEDVIDFIKFKQEMDKEIITLKTDKLLLEMELSQLKKQLPTKDEAAAIYHTVFAYMPELVRNETTLSFVNKIKNIAQ